MENSGNVECGLKLKMDDLLGSPSGYIDHSDLLFHYTKTQTAPEVLESQALMFNAMTNTDDPLECCPPAHVGIRSQPAMSASSSVCSDLQTQELDKEHKKGKLACFCISNASLDIGGWFDLGCFRPRMWSQHAEKHKGVCFVFSKSKLLKTGGEWAREEGYELFEGAVEYDNKLKALQSVLSVSQAEPLSNRIKNNSAAYYFSKREDYRDEVEYRMVIYHEILSQDEQLLVPYKTALKGIILGPEFPREQNDLFVEEARRLNIFLAQISWGIRPYLDPVYSCWR